MNKRQNRYIAYVRVSSYEQANKNLSIPFQIEQIENYIKQNEFILEKVFKEEHSAFRENRPIFNEMVKEIKERNDISGLIIFQYSRISRNIDDFIKIEKLLKNKNMQIISITEPMLNSYLGKYMIRDIQNRAILYSEELSFRTKLGMRKKLQIGGNIFGTPPFGFVRENGKLIPEKNKSKIIKFIFNNYAKGNIGYINLANLVREKFNLKKFTPKQATHTIGNSIYCGYISKVWHLGPEEYIFWGYDKPGTYIEKYELNYITPIISKELFEKCQKVRELNNRVNFIPTGISKFPKIFKCVCGRNLRRGDRKGIRYLRCHKKINGKFQTKCNELHIRLDKLEIQIEYIVRKIVGTKEERYIVKNLIYEKIKSFENDNYNKNIEIDTLIKQYETKLSEITDSFINNVIDKELYEKTVKIITEKINNIEFEKKIITNNKQFLSGGYKFLEFLGILETYEGYLNNSSLNKKSPRIFGLFFKVCADCIVCSEKIVSYTLFEPFCMLKNDIISEWGG